MAIAAQSPLSKKSSLISSSSKNLAKKMLLQRSLKCKTKKVTFDVPSESIASYEPKVSTTIVKPLNAQAKEVSIRTITKASAMHRAEEVQVRLEPEFPSFVKQMLPSHVTGGFWLSFPKRFCDLHLPKHDEAVVLVNEHGKEFETKYLVEKNGLSGGWRGYSIAHKLLEGDVLIFQLINLCKFKVYVVRINDLTELDGAISLLQLDGRAKPLNICLPAETEMKNHAKLEAVEPASMDHSRESVEEKDAIVDSDQSGFDKDGLGSGSEVLEGIRFSQSVVDLKDVKNMKDFNVFVDGLIIDSEIPKHVRIKYYDLCCSQNSYLHENLVKGLNIKLVAGIISETVNIADAIRACKLTTSQDDFGIWEKTLKAFEEMGMKVGFLRARMVELERLSYESKEVLEAKRLERAKAEEEKTIIMDKLFNLGKVIKNLTGEIETLQLKSEQLEPEFRKVARAPW